MPCLSRCRAVLVHAALAVAALVLLAAVPAYAQISFTSAIDLALRNSPKVKSAEAEVARASAALSETKDVYVPSVIASSGLGYSYGYPLGTPTIFSFQAQSLVFNFSQVDYIRAARAGLTAANLSLKDVRQQVAEDAATSYLALDRSLQRKAAMQQEFGYAAKLVDIVNDRLEAGEDTPMELSRARRTKLQLQLQQLQMEDDIESRAGHLDHLLGIAGERFETVPGSVPEIPIVSASTGPIADSPAVLAAVASAQAKREQAFGDARYILRPQVAFAGQYSRFSTFNNYQLFYPAITNNLNAFGVGIQIQLPLYDAGHRAKAKESLAAATVSQNDAMYAREQEAEGRVKRQHSADELVLRAQLAELDNEIAKQQLETMLTELNTGSGNGNGPQMTPKDEQNARIQERQKYLDLLDSRFELQQIEIGLLRQTGQLEQWLKSILITP